MSTMNWKVYGASFATLLVSGMVLGQQPLRMLAQTVLSQQEVMLVGKDSSGNSRDVLVDSNGQLITSTSATAPSGAASGTHGGCINTTMNVGTTGTNCPPSPMTNRTSLLIQLVQSTQILTITTDGSTVATATNGISVTDESAYTDNLAGTVNANCRCDAATCSVRIVECP